MKIAIVHPYPWPEVRRGAERYLDDLAWYMAGRGHIVEVITGTHGPPKREIRPDGVNMTYKRHLDPGPLSRFGVTEIETFGERALLQLLRGGFDVIHAFTPSGALAGRASRRPTVYTILGHPDTDQLPTSWIPRHLFLRAIRSSTVTAALSQASLDALRAGFGRDGVVLPPGVRIQRFEPNLQPRTGPIRILYSASLGDKRKRPDLAVSALGFVLDHHPDARMGLSGSGDASWVLEIASQCGERVRAAIDVLGPGDPEEVPSRYRESTVTVLPAEHEAFGLALVESLASGTPVACTPTGGMPEILGKERVGAVATESTPRALADAIEAAIAISADPSTPRLCAHRARKWAWNESVGPAHEHLYDTIARRAHSRGAGGASRTQESTPGSLSTT